MLNNSIDSFKEGSKSVEQLSPHPIPKNGHFSEAVTVVYIKNFSFSGYFPGKNVFMHFSPGRMFYSPKGTERGPIVFT